MTTIKTVVRINNVEVTLTRLETSAGLVEVVVPGACGGVFDMDADDAATFADAVSLATSIYGAAKKGRVANCSNSEVHEIWRLMQQVAGV
jgi:hypothetical protein